VKSVMEVVEMGSRGCAFTVRRRRLAVLAPVGLALLCSCSPDAPPAANTNAPPSDDGNGRATATSGPTSRAALPGTLNAALAAYGLSMGKAGDAPLAGDFRRKGSTIAFHSLLAADNDLRVEIEIMSPLTPDLAKRYLNSKYTIVRSLYGPQPHPYPGVITNITDCPDDKKPVERSVQVLGRPVTVLLANASARYTFGVWEDDLIKHRAAFCVVYVPETKALFEIKIFQPSARFNADTVLRALGNLKLTSG